MNSVKRLFENEVVLLSKFFLCKKELFLSHFGTIVNSYLHGIARIDDGSSNGLGRHQLDVFQGTIFSFNEFFIGAK